MYLSIVIVRFYVFLYNFVYIYNCYLNCKTIFRYLCARKCDASSSPLGIRSECTSHGSMNESETYCGVFSSSIVCDLYSAVPLLLTNRGQASAV